MSTGESVKGLVQWAAGVTAEGLRQDAERWLKKVRTTRGQHRLAEGLAEEDFRSEELRESLKKILSDPQQCTVLPR